MADFVKKEWGEEGGRRFSPAPTFVLPFYALIVLPQFGQ
jgi:hypothetical protein